MFEAPSPSLARRGSITAEWVLTLPAVMLVVGVLLGGISLALDQSRLHSAATDAVRLASLGAETEEIRSHVHQIVGDAEVSLVIDEAHHTVCAALRRSAPPIWHQLLPVPDEVRSCGLYPGVDKP